MARNAISSAIDPSTLTAILNGRRTQPRLVLSLAPRSRGATVRACRGTRRPTAREESRAATRLGCDSFSRPSSGLKSL